MLRVGLTGGIGCGKSTAVDAFRVLGTPIIDADQISKELVKPKSKALDEISKTLGSGLLLKNGELNRPLLKQKIFSDPKTLEQLETILHPRIKAEIENQISAINARNDYNHYVIVDIPLLVEKNYQDMFDQIIVVDCLPEQQIQRVSLRDKLSDSDIKRIMKNQATRAKRNNAATEILDNTKDKETLLSQINRLHKALVALS
ncbi:MAG: dephospho-CoA kinase [Cocleimonas sp.]|nr:dephospho-CoA kinase [Cocleimonas sp.]